MKNRRIPRLTPGRIRPMRTFVVYHEGESDIIPMAVQNHGGSVTMSDDFEIIRSNRTLAEIRSSFKEHYKSNGKSEETFFVGELRGHVAHGAKILTNFMARVSYSP